MPGVERLNRSIRNLGIEAWDMDENAAAVRTRTKSTRRVRSPSLRGQVPHGLWTERHGPPPPQGCDPGSDRLPRLLVLVMENGL
jgi:hypothetical protein